jgi:hypothetical protein
MRVSGCTTDHITKHIKIQWIKALTTSHDIITAASSAPLALMTFSGSTVQFPIAATNRLERDDSMIDDRQRHPLVSGSRPGEARARGPSETGRAGSRALYDDLQTLRDSVLQRLESIEVLARRRLSAPTAESSRLEQSLKQKIEELEHERSRLRGGLEEKESTYRRLMTELESDRQMLTEAWERLERERIDATATGGDHGSPAHRSRQSERAAVPVTPAPTSSATSATNVEAANPVTETILRQFQTLCSDVRRTADSRCSPR